RKTEDVLDAFVLETRDQELRHVPLVRRRHGGSLAEGHRTFVRPWGRSYGRPWWTALPRYRTPIRAAAALGHPARRGGGRWRRAPALALAREGRRDRRPAG